MLFRPTSPHFVALVEFVEQCLDGMFLTNWLTYQWHTFSDLDTGHLRTVYGVVKLV